MKGGSHSHKTAITNIILTTNADEANEDDVFVKKLSQEDSKSSSIKSRKEGPKWKTMTDQNFEQMRIGIGQNASAEFVPGAFKSKLNKNRVSSVDQSRNKKPLQYKFVKKEQIIDREVHEEDTPDGTAALTGENEGQTSEQKDSSNDLAKTEAVSLWNRGHRPPSLYYANPSDLPITYEQLQILDQKFLDNKPKRNDDKKEDDKDGEIAQLVTQHRVLYSPEAIKLQRLHPKSTEAEKDQAKRLKKMKARRVLNNSKMVFSPNGKAKILWDIVCMLLIVYDVLTVPFFLSFNVSEGENLAKFDFAATIYFLTDILLSCNTGYFEKGDLIMDRKAILTTYFKGWFWIDFISSFPVGWLLDSPVDFAATDSQGSGRFYQLFKILRFLRVIRLLRILKLRRILNKFAQFFYVSLSVSIFIGFTKLSLMILTIAHWIACLWHYIAVSEIDTSDTNWMRTFGIENDSWDVQYISSVYWATTTMVTIGYGDIIPVTISEKMFAMSVMLIACGIFGFVMNKINELLLEMDSKSSSYKYNQSKHVNIPFSK